MSLTSDALDRLTAEVDGLTTIDDSAITLLNGLSQLLKDNATNPSAIVALADKVKAEAVKMTAAITANTPAA